jgi:hypothetical protein
MYGPSFGGGGANIHFPSTLCQTFPGGGGPGGAVAQLLRKANNTIDKNSKNIPFLILPPFFPKLYPIMPPIPNPKRITMPPGDENPQSEYAIIHPIINPITPPMSCTFFSAVISQTL